MEISPEALAQESLEKDAARYRWIRLHMATFRFIGRFFHYDHVNEGAIEGVLDSAVDAAIAQQIEQPRVTYQRPAEYNPKQPGPTYREVTLGRGRPAPDNTYPAGMDDGQFVPAGKP